MTTNIEKGGRAIRGGLALIFLLAAALLFSESGWLAALFLIAGLFTLFEAARGWCAVRACGFKTPF